MINNCCTQKAARKLGCEVSSICFYTIGMTIECTKYIGIRYYH